MLDIPIVVDAVSLLNSILDCYKDVKISEEIQKTEREKIREQARVFIAAIEADTKKFEIAVNKVGNERMALVTAICDVLRKGVLDENSVKVCEMFLNHLTQNNPYMSLTGANSKFPDSLSLESKND